MEVPENYKHIQPKSWDGLCFGCSPANPAGLHMKFYTDGKSVCSWVKVPDHLCGWNNLVHGGVISTMVDEVMGWTAIHLLKLIVLTKTMTVDFIHPVYIGDELKVEGRVTEYNDNGTVVIEATVHNEHGQLCTKSTGTFSYFPPDTIREMGIMDNEFLNEFEKYIEESDCQD